MLTREHIHTVYEPGSEAVGTLVLALQEQMDALAAEVKVLRERLDKDSHNSPKPPSSDGLAKKPVSLRPKTGRKPGGQSDHPGRTLTFSATPDEIVVHTRACCACWGTSLATVAGREVQSRQGVDMPPLSLVTTEHRGDNRASDREESLSRLRL